jgi:succinoglycan biosynthesis protein ExoA
MPLISVIIPCYNEETTIGLLLNAIYVQTAPREDLEVILADGISSDRTLQKIQEFQEAHPDLAVRVVDNPKRIIPAALNCALAAAQGEFIVRLDAHSIPSADYVELCIKALRADKGENVGGIWEIRPGKDSWIGRSIAAAAAHPFGVGDALYRYTRQAGYVDTVPFGSFRRSLIDKIGWFDESLLTNEDYEFNTRVRLNGGRVWLDPQIHSVYFARRTLGELVKQYWRYGYWKFRMLIRYPTTLRWRQALPPVFVVSLIALGILSLVWPLARLVFGLELLCYFLVLWMGSVLVAFRKKDLRLLVGIPLAIISMHLSWGGGFIYSLLTTGKH